MKAIPGDTLRIIDANLNRIGEGLRFIEEVARLSLNDAVLTQQLKNMRHEMVRVDWELQQQLLQARDAEGDVGIDMEIKAMDSTIFSSSILKNKAHDQMSWYGKSAMGYAPVTCLNERYSTGPNNLCMVKDPVFDKMVDRVAASLDLKEQKRLVREADDYCVAQQWSANLLRVVNFIVYQPWLKGYWGQASQGIGTSVALGADLARLWIDKGK